MKILSENDIKFLVESGLLMPAIKGYEETKVYPGKEACISVSYKKIAGYPIVVSTHHDVSDLFPSINNEEYLFPQRLNDILQDKENGWLETQPLFKASLKKWGEIAYGYIKSDPSRNSIEPFEKDLLTSFRQAYAVYLCTNHESINFCDDTILKLIVSGAEYRSVLNDYMRDIYDSLPSRDFIVKYISDNILKNTDDIIAFEKAIINKNAYPYNTTGASIKPAMLWTEIITEKYNEKYMGPSPLLDVLREKLYDSKEKDINYAFSWLEVYDISVIKEDLLYFFNKSNNSSVMTYVKYKLQKHNELPDSSSILLKQNIQTVSKKTIQLDANSIRKKVNHHLYATEKLIEIIITAFKQDEKDYSYIGSEIIFHDSVINVYIESPNKKTTQELSENFLCYIQASISEVFLTEDMTEKISNHMYKTEHEKYENDINIMASYKQIKNSFLFNKQLQDDLPEPRNKSRLNKI